MGSKKKLARNNDFDWERYPELDKFIAKHVSLFLAKNNFAKSLSDRMHVMTSTRFVDWVDHIALPEDKTDERELAALGLTEIKEIEKPGGARVFRHLRSYLFPVMITAGKEMVVALKPESIDDFLQYIGLGVVPDGEPFSAIRHARISKEGNYALDAIERRGYDGFLGKDGNDVGKYLETLTQFYCRKRYFDSDEEGMAYTKALVKNAVGKLDSARVSDAFFRIERAYWQKRNRAGQVQKSRQDTLGLGWGNHDHHTYRSSRANFTKMIDIFEIMGYTCREKYYAGEKAGWGAQILEHRVCNIVVFTDVDLAPQETRLDFSHEGLQDRKELGTVGLWVGLHGESMLQAGMHHLEARFDFERLRSDLEKQGVIVMQPFSYFDFLKQAFTQGDLWPVDKIRLGRLLTSGSITREQFDKFAKEGAIGSHMENLERDQGFKGFNKASVTKIISATDPRKQNLAGA